MSSGKISKEYLEQHATQIEGFMRALNKLDLLSDKAYSNVKIATLGAMLAHQVKVLSQQMAKTLETTMLGVPNLSDMKPGSAIATLLEACAEAEIQSFNGLEQILKSSGPKAK